MTDSSDYLAKVARPVLVSIIMVCGIYRAGFTQPASGQLENTDGLVGGFKFMTTLYAWCGEPKLSEIYGRAIMESFDQCPFSEQAKRRAHSLVNDFTTKLNHEIQSYIDKHGRLPSEPFDEKNTCRNVHEGKDTLEFRGKLELYDQGKIGADAVFRKEDRCFAGPFGL